jgi:hypothetical protein
VIGRSLEAFGIIVVGAALWKIAGLDVDATDDFGLLRGCVVRRRLVVCVGRVSLRCSCIIMATGDLSRSVLFSSILSRRYLSSRVLFRSILSIGIAVSSWICCSSSIGVTGNCCSLWPICSSLVLSRILLWRVHFVVA